MSLKNPEISIIMNCFNGAAYLAESVQSVIAQTFPDWEIVFWDNQSTDQSEKIIKSFRDKRIRYFYAPRHTNLGEARNLAIAKSRASWIAFLDCDDLWMPEKLQEQIKVIREETHKKSNLGLVYCRTTIFGEGIQEKEPAWYKRWERLPEGDIFYEYLLTTNFISLLSAVINKKIFFNTGGIPLQYKQVEDYFMFAAISEVSQVKVINKTLCRYRVHSGNLTNKQKMLTVTETIELLNHWKEKFHQTTQIYQNWKKKIKSLEAMKFVYLILLNKEYKKAFKLLIRENILFEVFRFVILRKEF